VRRLPHGDVRDDRLAVTVRGWPGRRAEWQHVADRIEALDGELSVDTSDAGTVLQAVVPLAVAARA
jgi:signal transduction histidine kinase